MGRALGRLLLLVTTAALVSACATSEQWAEWRKHSTHFASGQHMGFSMRNRGANPIPRVRQRDIASATAQSWWGDPILVRPDQIFAD